HVGTTDRDDDQHADDEGQHGQRGERTHVTGDGEVDAQRDDGDAEDQVQQVLALEDHRGTLEQAELVLAGQLAEGDHRTGEGDGTDGRTEEQLDAVGSRDGVAHGGHDAQRLRFDHGSDGDEHGSQTDHAVHEGHQLRHLGHFDALGHDGTGAATDHQAGEHEAQAFGQAQRDALGGELVDLQLDQADGGEHRDGHADHAEHVTATRSGRVGQTFQRLDKADRSDEVQNSNQVHAHD